MNRRKILAFIMSLALVACSFSACGDASTPGEKNDDALTESPDSITLVDDNSINGEEVTAITAATDVNGNIVDSVGITDNSGHKVYSTGQTDEAGKTIYTTGKKATNGDVLYTKNDTDSFGNLVYFTGKYDANGKLVLTPTNEAPDYTTNDTPKNKVIQGTTTTSTTISVKDNSKVTITDTSCKYTKYFGGSGFDTFAAVDADDNGGYAAVGTSGSVDGDLDTASKEWSGTHAMVVKYAADGSQSWKYVIGGDGNIFLYDVAVLKDGTTVAVGCTFATDIDAPSHSKMFSGLILRIDKNGNLMWMYSFPGDTNSNGEYISSVCAAPDGGFVVGGKADSTAGFFNGTKSGGSKAFLFKFDKNCNVKWRKILTGSKSNNFAGIDINSSGEIYATCVTTSLDGDFAAIKYTSAVTANTVLIKMSKGGDLKWAKYLEGSGNSEFKAVTATSDGGCIVAGSYTIMNRADGIYSMNYGSSDGYIIRYSSDGEVYWARSIGGSQADYANGVAEVDGGFVVVGQTKSADFNFQGQKIGGAEDGFIAYLNEKGELSTMVILDGTSSDSATAVVTLSDGTIAVTGWTKSKDNAFSGSNAANQYMAFVSRYEAITEKK